MCVQSVISKGFLMNNKIKNILQLFGAFLGFGILYACKMFYIAGSSHSFFSLTNVYMPFSGIFGVLGIVIALVLKASYAYAFSIFSHFFLVYHIPTISASGYWISRKMELLFGFFVPALCMILFTVHPIGSQVYQYSFYWFIPMIITLLGVRSLFARSMASTFIAHAVGSIIWLHTHPCMTSAQWMALIPVVAYERCLFACLMVIGYRVAKDISTMIVSLWKVFVLQSKRFLIYEK